MIFSSGRLYFSHENSRGTAFIIEQSALDGSNRKVLLNSSQPIGSLTINVDSKHLYFIRNQTGGIDFLDLKTGKVHVVVQPDEIHPKRANGLAIHKDTIYFADNTDKTIVKCDKPTCDYRTTVRLKYTNSTYDVHSLAMFYSDAQRGQNACSNDTKKCDHLCLATSSETYVCKCAIAYSVDPNNSSKCIGEKEFLLYSMGHKLHGIRLNGSASPTQDDQMQYVLTPIPRLSRSTKIDYHYRDDWLFFADRDEAKIIRIKRNGTNRQVVFYYGYGEELGVTAMAVDWIADNIYWCIEHSSYIEVARLDGSLRHVIISDATRPSEISVDPIAGYLFYIDYNRNGKYRFLFNTNNQANKIN